MRRAYIAGFDVFRPDAVEWMEVQRELLRRYGIEGLFPLDNEATDSAEIFRGNTGMIDRCDFVIANLNPFRGAEPDSGTAFEVGYACRAGKQVYGYLSDGRTLREKLGPADEAGYAVENFGYPVNLMLALGARIVPGDFENCVRTASGES